MRSAHEAQEDVAALVALHTDEAVIVNLAGRRVFGSAALAEAMTAALASPLRDVRTSVEIVDVRLTGQDSAVVSCVKTVHDRRDDAAGGESLPARGALTYLLVRLGAAWRIALAQTTPIMS